MARGEFIEMLDMFNFKYNIEGKDIVIYEGEYKWDSGFVSIKHFDNIPPNIVFKNAGNVEIESDKIPANIKFYNVGDVRLISVKSIDPSVSINNYLDVTIVFKGIKISSRMSTFYSPSAILLVGDEFDNKISPKRVLNLMISKGIFV